MKIKSLYRKNWLSGILLLLLLYLTGGCSLFGFMMTGYNITIDVKDTSDNDFDIKHYFDEYMIAKECDWQFGSKTDSGYHCGKYMIEVIYTYYYENGGNRKIKSIIIRNVRYGYRIREEIDKLAYELKNELETMVDKDNVTINKRRTIYID